MRSKWIDCWYHLAGTIMTPLPRHYLCVQCVYSLRRRNGKLLANSFLKLHHFNRIALRKFQSDLNVSGGHNIRQIPTYKLP